MRMGKHTGSTWWLWSEVKPVIPCTWGRAHIGCALWPLAHQNTTLFCFITDYTDFFFACKYILSSYSPFSPNRPVFYSNHLENVFLYWSPCKESVWYVLKRSSANTDDTSVASVGSRILHHVRTSSLTLTSVLKSSFHLSSQFRSWASWVSWPALPPWPYHSLAAARCSSSGLVFIGWRAPIHLVFNQFTCPSAPHQPALVILLLPCSVRSHPMT